MQNREFVIILNDKEFSIFNWIIKYLLLTFYNFIASFFVSLLNLDFL